MVYSDTTRISLMWNTFVVLIQRGYVNIRYGKGNSFEFPGVEKTTRVAHIKEKYIKRVFPVLRCGN